MQIIIRPPVQDDRAQWEQLYQEYAGFYEVEKSAEKRAKVWGWLFDEAEQTNGLVADDGQGRLLGLAHFRAFSRPLAASTGGYLDDLFVSPEARGSGAAAALIEGVRAIGVARGWSVIRWITAQDNARARTLYDRVAQETPWVTYDLEV